MLTPEHVLELLDLEIIIAAINDISQEQALTSPKLSVAIFAL